MLRLNFYRLKGLATILVLLSITISGCHSLQNGTNSDSKRDASKDVFIPKGAIFKAENEPFEAVPWGRYCWLMECENMMGAE